MLVVYSGYVIHADDYYELPAKTQSYFYQVGDERFFGSPSLYELSAGELISHSCNPNVGFSSVIRLVVLRESQVGEQVTYDHAVFVTFDEESMECFCGESICCQFFARQIG